MQYRTLGKTGFSVSEIGLGCEHLQGKSRERIEKVVHTALDAGVNILDVFMSEPEVRSDIGRALAGRRDKVYLQGHIGAIWEDGQYARSRDIGACELFVQDFLTRYQTDYIDIGMIHFIDTPEDLAVVENGPILAYAQRLKEKGVLRTIGLSSHDPLTARLAVEHGWVDALMFSVNPAYDLLPENTYIDEYFAEDTWKNAALSGVNPVRTALYDACSARGVGITVMKAFGGGRLLSPQLSPFGQALTTAQLMHYVLSCPGVGSVLVGCQTAAEVQQALAYETASVEERDYGAVLAGTSLYQTAGQCVYCNHCHPCPVGIDIAAVNRSLDLLSTDENAARAGYAALSAHGGDCIACGVCEARCPFHVGVAGRMQTAAEAFGN